MSLVTRDSLVDQVIGRIRAEVAAGRWPVGSRLPAEPVLAETLGVGRSTVREAVRSLVHTGLLTVRQGHGTFVKAANELEAVLREHLKLVDLIHAFEARRPVEVELARLAARRRTPEEVERIAAALAARTAAERENQLELFVAADVRFHQEIAAASRNPVLVTLYQGFSGTLRESVEGVLHDEEMLHRPSPWHHRLFEAVAAGDEQEAMLAAGMHLTETLDTLRQRRRTGADPA
jgi:DNA-binding FadR family transcriptional regulator